MSCIYQLKFPSGECYIGKSVDPTPRGRVLKHISVARSTEVDYAVSRAIRKYGADSFEVSVLYSGDADKELLALAEVEAIDKWGTKFPKGYNLTDGGEGSIGFSYGDEAKKRMSRGQRLRWDAPRQSRFAFIECMKENRPFSDILGVLTWQK